MDRIRRRFLVHWTLGVAYLIGCSSQEPDFLALSDSGNPAKTSGDTTRQRVTQDKSKQTNRLAREISPYLLLHAHNPVDWYPWGPEAFEKAQREGKLIFLSIGYSSCYWCHVMERKVFSDEKIAAIMNDHFVNIKVDREERPDIDDIYMTALNIYFQLAGSSQGGGWPLSMFLTPEGKPIVGGTYFPPEDDHGRLGFPKIMKNILDAWKHQRKAVTQNAEILTQHVRRAMKPRPVLNPVTLKSDLITATNRALLATYDPVHGGVDFDSGNPNRPKFPVPTKLALLQSVIAREADNQAETVVYHTLNRIASGGICDQVAGGFHRYSTDRAWLVPHFEKMLYDNAQLMDVYVEAYRQTKKTNYREVAEGIAAFVADEMTDPQGGFYSALDAETDAIEGKFYVWTLKEVENILGQRDASLFQEVFGMHEEDVFEHGFVLHLPKPLKQVATEKKRPLDELKEDIRNQRRKILDARNQRERPFRDDKILTSWNGLMIRGLANAGKVLGRGEYLAAAQKAAQFILSSMRDSEGHLLRTYRADQAKLNAYLDDYAFLIEGLLSLYEATGQEKWLNASRRLTDDQINLFWDSEGDGFFFTSHHHEELLARTKNAYDSVLPSGNSVSVRNLVRLASASKQSKYRVYARKTLKLFAPKLKEQPRAMANMALALAEFLDDPGVDETHPDKLPKADNPDERAIIPISDASEAAEKKKDERVTAKAYLSIGQLSPGSKCQIAVILDIAKGWHINTNPAKPNNLIPTRLTIKSKQGTQLTDIQYPKGKKLTVDGFEEPIHVYDEQAAIYGTLDIPSQAAGKLEEIEISIHYQPCHDSRCLLPQSTRFTAKLKVVQRGEHVKQINQTLFHKTKESKNP